MFYRRKIILSLLELFDGELEKIKIQKLLFLYTRRQQQAVYDFVPYKYGCYSFSVNADLSTMTKKGVLTESSTLFKKNDNADYLKSLKKDDYLLLHELKELYGKMNSSALMKHTYINFPYWATKSEVAASLLTNDQFEKVKNKIPSKRKTTLFTIGYEGISLEEYLNRLIINDVKILVDVRKNPLSMKFGFSKTLLKRYCNSLGIEYMHFPEVGIHGSKRQELNNQADYDSLFDEYRRDNLTNTVNTQKEILNLLKEHKRIALTCFEANICQCHRKHLAESIETLTEFKYEVKHI